MNHYILHLETATKVCSVALSLNGEVVSVKETEEDGYSHGENLNLFITPKQGGSNKSAWEITEKIIIKDLINYEKNKI